MHPAPRGPYRSHHQGRAPGPIAFLMPRLRDARLNPAPAASPLEVGSVLLPPASFLAGLLCNGAGATAYGLLEAPAR